MWEDAFQVTILFIDSRENPDAMNEKATLTHMKGTMMRKKKYCIIDRRIDDNVTNSPPSKTTS